jgi:hypothetical protein
MGFPLLVPAQIKEIPIANRVLELLETIQNLNIELRKKDRRIQSLEKENAQLKNQLANSKVKRDEVSKQRDAARKNATTYAQDAVRYKKELDDANRTILNAENELSGLRVTITNLTETLGLNTKSYNAEIQGLNQEIAALEAQLQEKERIHQELCFFISLRSMSLNAKVLSKDKLSITFSLNNVRGSGNNFITPSQQIDVITTVRKKEVLGTDGFFLRTPDKNGTSNLKSSVSIDQPVEIIFESKDAFKNNTSEKIEGIIDLKIIYDKYVIWADQKVIAI